MLMELLPMHSMHGHMMQEGQHIPMTLRGWANLLSMTPYNSTAVAPMEAGSKFSWNWLFSERAQAETQRIPRNAPM